MPEYANRDIIEQGDHYAKHIDAMTTEGLHDKSAIAAELAHRDILIEQLLASSSRLYDALDKLLYTKDYKEKHGKTPHYETCRAISWDIAEQVINASRKVSVGKIQAEAVEAAINSCKEVWKEFDHPDIEICTVEDLTKHAQQLRDEAES